MMAVLSYVRQHKYQLLNCVYISGLPAATVCDLLFIKCSAQYAHDNLDWDMSM